MPLSDDLLSDRAVPSIPAEPARSARILIVEDEFLIALTTEAELVSAGHVVVGKAASFDKAMDIARSTAPDLVVMDVRLGAGRDGIEAALAMRQELDLPSVIATGSIDDENRRRAGPARPLAWLAKPYTGDDLLATVAAALAQIGREAAKPEG